jgi:transcription-repair coupling factor (superfamily II helicase)
MLIDTARKRLAAIRRYTQLGAGFKLALRDLEIRGSGNILGAEQSGYIAAIGFDLYCQLLREAVARLKQQPLPQRPTTQVDIDFVAYGHAPKRGLVSACIPREYLREETLRVELYRRISELHELAAADDLLAELRDRFGEPPPEVLNLLTIARIRIRAMQAKVHAITVREDRVMLESGTGYLKDGQRLMPRLGKSTGAARLAELLAIVERFAR